MVYYSWINTTDSYYMHLKDKNNNLVGGWYITAGAIPSTVTTCTLMTRMITLFKNLRFKISSDGI